MRRAVKFFFLLVLQMAALNAIAQGTLYTLVSNAPTAQRLNVVILAEGYTASQVSQFTNDARTLAKAMLTKPPYNEYTNYFNIYAIFVPSVESGSDHPRDNLYHNTYFNSTYDTYGVERLLTIPYTGGQDKMNALLAGLMPEYDLACILVNDAEYGGSGGSVLVCSMHSLSPDVFVHEGAHTLGGLGDEYDSAYSYPDFEEPNTTTQTNRSLIKWNAWILPTTPIPTYYSANAELIGLFEGAHYHTNGWYRPKDLCTMRVLGSTFCSVCSEQLVKSVYEIVPPINTSTPPTNSTIQLAGTGTATFTVTPNQPSAHHLSIQWFTNGVLVAGATNGVFNLAGSSLHNGANSLKVKVHDSTPLVRTDPDQLLADARAWSVNVTSSGVLQTNIVSATIQNGVRLSWTTHNGATYTVQWTDRLAPNPVWNSLAAPIAGDGTIKSMFDPIGINVGRFYQVLQSP